MNGSEQSVEDGVFIDPASACVALVPTVAAVQSSLRQILPRPDASFVTQLLANAEYVAQARRRRRGSPEDAQTAYTADRTQMAATGFRTRHTI
jgi:hypothetical protein